MPDLYTCCRTAKLNNRKLLSIYLTVGFPQPSWTLELGKSIFDAGADIIELGIPFSDPLADGPVIQSASMTALRAHTTLSNVFEICSQLSLNGACLLMGYTNSIVGYGRKKFLNSVKSSNASGLIIPDLPIDEEVELWNAARENTTPLIPFIAPTSSTDRMKLIDQVNSPFIYAVSLTGVTGTRNTVAPETVNYLNIASKTVQTPILAGFGISNSEMAKQMSRYCDGIIVGSAVIQIIDKAATLESAKGAVFNFVKELRIAIDTH